jgi:prepilin-type N-terminal cleavage/methylation domain-containing protein
MIRMSSQPDERSGAIAMCRVTSHMGYTLIELLAVVAIFGILTAMGLPHIDTRREDINSAVNQLIADARFARSRSIATGTHFAFVWKDYQHYEVDRLKEDVTTGTWSLDSVSKQVELPEYLFVWWVPGDLEFNTRGMLYGESDTVWVGMWDSKFGGFREVSIWPSGQVYHDY